LSRAANAARKLIDVNKVDATVTIWNTTGIVLANAANPKGIINFMCSWEEEGLRGPYSYNMIARHADMAKAMIQELKKNKSKSVMLISDNVGSTLSDVLAKNLESAGIKVLSHDTVIDGQREFINEVARSRRLNPDTHIIIGDPGIIYMFTRRLFEATGKKNVTTIDGFTDVSADIRPFFDDLWYIDGNNMGTKEWQAHMLATTGKQSQSCAGNSAANVQLIVHAFENALVETGAVKPTRNAVNEYIQNHMRRFETDAAGTVTLDENGIMVLPPLRLIIKEGNIERLK
jgi:ABC-type branched-subunit amino acid transport system substrate-binding protein